MAQKQYVQVDNQTVEVAPRTGALSGNVKGYDAQTTGGTKAQTSSSGPSEEKLQEAAFKAVQKERGHA